MPSMRACSTFQCSLWIRDGEWTPSTLQDGLATIGLLDLKQLARSGKLIQQPRLSGS